jgi:glycine/sarcosine N-methyltransferase
VEEGLSVEDFYNDLAVDYHLLFQDWWEAAWWHGEIIGRLLLTLEVPPGARLLDSTCGIGTQALPLALRGYQVLGTDISPAAIDRARREADARGIGAEFVVCDIRQVGRLASSPFDAALACDNSFPHLRTDADLVTALRSIRTCLRRGGVFIASIRDYDTLSIDRPGGIPPVTYQSQGRRRIVGQAWQWSEDADTVLVQLFILQEEQGGWSCSVWTTQYRAWRRAELASALMTSGFDGATWHSTEESGYYQPIVTARAT